MFLKLHILFCVVLLLVHKRLFIVEGRKPCDGHGCPSQGFLPCIKKTSDAFVKRDVPSPPDPDPIDAFKKNFDSLRSCIDKSLAQVVSDVNIEKKLQPVFNVIGDQLNRFSKAFEDLTAPSSSPASFTD